MFYNNSLEYWLTQWINAYSFLTQEKFTKNKNIVYIGHEFFCENPKKVLKNLFKKINLHFEDINSNFEVKNLKKKIDIKDSSLIKKSQEIFEKLQKP